MKIICSELPILSLLDVPNYEFFESNDGYICQMLSNNKYQTILSPDRKTPGHEVIPFSRNEGVENLIIKRIDTLPNLLKSVSLTFKDVPSGSFFQIFDNSIWQKCGRDAIQLTNRDGTIGPDIRYLYSTEFGDDDQIKRIFPKDAVVKI